MNKITPEELLYLADELCPHCEQPIEYHEPYYVCPICKRAWLYGYVKDCLKAYDTNPQGYINDLT